MSQATSTVTVLNTSSGFPSAAQEQKRGARVARKVVKTVGFVLAEIAAALLIWQLVVTIFNINPQIVPGPLAVGRAFVGLVQSGLMVDAMLVTLQETLTGFLIAAVLGITLGIVLSELKWLYRIANPFIVLFQATPTIAIAPVLLIWFGFGITSKVILVVVMVFFPVLVNTLAGLNSVGREQTDLMRAYGASRWQTFKHLRMYAALPYVLASFEVSFVLSLTAAVVAEILGSGTTIGLGTLLQMFNQRLDMASMFAVVVFLSVLGILLYGAVKLAARYALAWRTTASH